MKKQKIQNYSFGRLPRANERKRAVNMRNKVSSEFAILHLERDVELSTGLIIIVEPVNGSVWTAVGLRWWSSSHACVILWWFGVDSGWGCVRGFFVFLVRKCLDLLVMEFMANCAADLDTHLTPFVANRYQ